MLSLREDLLIGTELVIAGYLLLDFQLTPTDSDKKWKSLAEALAVSFLIPKLFCQKHRVRRTTILPGLLNCKD